MKSVEKAKKRPVPVRKAYHHGDLQQALRAAVRELLAEGGTDALTLREAARRAGVNHRAVYRHFEDKRALLASLAEEGFEALTRRIAVAMAKLPEDQPAERLVALAVAYLRFAQENTSLFRLMFGRRLNEDERFPWLEKAVASSLVQLIAEMERGMASGAFVRGNARDRALSLWTLVHGYTDLVLLKRIRVRTQAIARRYLRDVLAPLLDGLSQPPR